MTRQWIRSSPATLKDMIEGIERMGVWWRGSKENSIERGPLVPSRYNPNLNEFQGSPSSMPPL